MTVVGKAGGGVVLSLVDTVVFFDLSGTLVEVDRRLLPERVDLLRRLGRRTRRIVLVTGQPFDDPQVQELVDVFEGADAPNFVAYTTRGGLRLAQLQGGLERDLAYLERTAIPIDLRRRALAEIDRALTSCGLHPLCPVKLLDDVAIRVNLPSAERVLFASFLTAHFASAGLPGLQVVTEGRTSVFTMLKGIGKRQSVLFEMSFDRGASGRVRYLYFGNEVERGNDREVLGIPHLEVYALGPCGPLPQGVHCQTIGTEPEHLYALIEEFLRTPTP